MSALLPQGPIIITAQMGAEDQRWADRLRQQHFPPERNFLKAHITLFHHLPPSQWPQIKRSLSVLARENPPPPAKLTEVLRFSQGVAYRIESPILLAMREDLAEQYRGLLTPQDDAKPRLHITIQNKADPSQAKALHAELSAAFSPRPITIAGLAAHAYLGGPWDSLGSWSFSGQ